VQSGHRFDEGTDFEIWFLLRGAVVRSIIYGSVQELSGEATVCLGVANENGHRGK